MIINISIFESVEDRSNIIYTPIISSNISYNISCRDEDHDGYCNWGISTNKPTNCPPGACAEKDADDSDPGVGPFYTNYYPRLIPVTNFSAGDGTCTDKVALTWTRNASPQVLGYAIWRDGGPASVCLTTNVVITGVWGVVSLETNVVSTNYDDTTALPGTNYTYRLSLYNLQGMGGDLWSSNTGYRALSPVTGVAASDGVYYDKIRLTWSASEGAAGYWIYRHTNDVSSSASPLGTASTTNYDDTSASVGLLYYYWVKATNASGVSGFSSPDIGRRATSLSIPNPPAGVTASDGVYTDKVQVTWGVVTNAAGYSAWRNLSNDTGSASNIGFAAGTNYADTDTQAGVTYYYWLKATNAAGASGFSAGDSGFRTPSTTSLTAPTGVSASDGIYTDKIAVTWTEVSEAGNYQIWRAGENNVGAAVSLGNVTLSSYDDNSSAVRSATMYYYWVKAWNSVATSEFNNVDSGFCRLNPDAEIISGQPVVGDYDGDGKADPAVYDLASGRLFAWLSSAEYVFIAPVATFQVSVGDLPVAGDFDGDRLADPGVFNPVTGSWYIWLSSAGYYRVGPVLCGLDANDIPIPADYDGDGLCDPAVYVPSLGKWRMWMSGGGYGLTEMELR